MTLALLSIGTALPRTIVTQADGLRIAQSLCSPTAEQVTWLPTMYGHTGIDKRHLSLGQDVVRDILEDTRFSQSVFLPKGTVGDLGPTTGQRMQLYAELAPPLALSACKKAVEESGFHREDFTHLVTVSCTGFGAPGIDLALIEGLGLRPTIQRTHVGYMGCHGALNGLRVASAFTGADTQARVLLCAVELSSLHYHFGWDPQKMVANALFADGAAAVVGAPGPKADGWGLRASGSCILPGSAEAMTWIIGDHGFEMTLSKRVPGLIAEYLRPWLEDWLRESGLEMSAISSWAVHPGGPRILSAVEEGLELRSSSLAASREVFASCGNMSSPTILFILDLLRRHNAPRPCVALAFGPGVAAEAALFV